MKRFVARALVVVAAILGIVFAQVAPASAKASDELVGNLSTLWTKVLETPALDNPFIGNDGPACWDLGNSTIAQFGPIDPTVPKECTVEPGTKIFVVGFSYECSTIPGDDGGPGLTEGQLRKCARDNDLKKAPTITVNGQSETVTEVKKTSGLNINLPEDEDNIFDVLVGPTPGGTYLSVAHGWVTLSDPLPPGNHTIVIEDPIHGTTTTTIVVTPGD